MEPVFTLIVVILVVLAVSGLVVGVSNDAVNFLNSAIGSKVAPRKVILAIASVGLLIGTMTSSGMMEVARSGVFYPEMFNFRDVMILFLGVMFANVILLDLFNTFGLPTSTTVSLVFGLLGAAIAVASAKIWGTDNLNMSDLSSFINSGRAMAIISAILVSVVVAFISGSIVMLITRIIFTFRYQKIFSRFGSLWCGFAFTAIVYYTVIKGLKGTSILPAGLMEWADSHTFLFMLAMTGVWSVLMFFVQKVLKFNILRITVLAGTFSLALAFAGNDLVNFIGVPMAGIDSYRMAKAAGDTSMMMGGLNEAVSVNFIYIMTAGAIMIAALWFSKKAQTVSDTEINLARGDEGSERFGSTLMSRTIVRIALSASNIYQNVTPRRMQLGLERRFLPAPTGDEPKAPFDLIRATVNLTVAALLISFATSLKLPLSTTYVTFMVAMGTSLADRAWGRESAVYRITGVLTVISGWFVTALIAFVIAYGATLILAYGGTVAVLAVTALCVLLLLQSAAIHRKRAARAAAVEAPAGPGTPDEIMSNIIADVHQTMLDATKIYRDTLIGIFNEDRKLLKTSLKESEELFYNARDRKYGMMPTLQRLQGRHIETSHYYVQMVDYISEVSKALVHITRPCYDHIVNGHEGMPKEQITDLMRLDDEMAKFNDKMNSMISTNNYEDIDGVLLMRDELFVIIEEALRNQIKRLKKGSGTKASFLYFTILNETKTIILQSRNLLKSQRFFIENREH